MAEPDLFPNFEFTPKPPSQPKADHPISVLMGLTEKIRNLEPWKTLNNDHLIGVNRGDDPQEMQLMTVLGNAGEYFAIQFHCPPEGLLFYNQLMDGGEVDPGPGMANLRFFDCEFVNSDGADPRDLVTAGVMGSHPRKKNGIPSIRSYRPGFIPWFLNEKEVKELIPMLRLFLHHYREIAENLDSFYNWADGAKMPTIPVLSLKKGRNADDPQNWEIKLQEIPIGKSRLPAPESDGYHPGYAKRKVTDEIWEFACTYMPTPVDPEDKSEGERPYFPKIVVGVVDDGVGLIQVKPEFYPGHRKSDAAAMQNYFRRFSDARKCLPKLVRVTSESEKLALQGIADRIGFQIAIEEQNLLPEFLESIIADAPRTDADMQEQIDQLLEVLPPGNPIRNLLLEGKFEEAFDAISTMMGGEPDNIIAGNFGSVGGSN